MPLSRLKPNVYRASLGHLRLWRDDLDELVRLVQQLPDVEVLITVNDEYAGSGLDDELVKLGSRLRSFEVTAREATADPSPAAPPREVIKVRLTKNHCLVEATGPDLQVMGLVDALRNVSEKNRRIPNLRMLFAYGLVGPNDPPPCFLLICGCIIFLVVDVVVLLQKPNPRAWNGSIIWGAITAVILIALTIGWELSHTILFTGTREKAPTFWQRRRADIGINVIVGIVFFVAGLLVAHLWPTS